MKEGFVFVMKNRLPIFRNKNYSELLREGCTVSSQSYYIIHDKKVYAEDDCDSLDIIEKTVDKYIDLQLGYLVELLWKDDDEPLFYYLDNVEEDGTGARKYGFRKIQRLHEKEEYSWSYKLYYESDDVLVEKNGFTSKDKCIADAQAQKDAYCWNNATIEYWETRTTRGVA